MPYKTLKTSHLLKVLSLQLSKIIFNLNNNLFVTNAGNYAVTSATRKPSNNTTYIVTYHGCRMHLSLASGTILPKNCFIVGVCQ